MVPKREGVEPNTSRTFLWVFGFSDLKEPFSLRTEDKKTVQIGSERSFYWWFWKNIDYIKISSSERAGQHGRH